MKKIAPLWLISITMFIIACFKSNNQVNPVHGKVTAGNLVVLAASEFNELIAFNEPDVVISKTGLLPSH